MKLKLMAAASHHTADFKVLAAEYRFAAEGLESLTPELKAGLLETGKSLTKEETGEIVKAIDACKDKKGLEFVMAVLKEAQKSPILKQKAEQITNSIKPKSSKSNTANNKTAGWFYDFVNSRLHDKDFDLNSGPLTKVVNFLRNTGVKIGLLLMVTSALYFIFTGVTFGLDYKPILDSQGMRDPLDRVMMLQKTGALSVILGLCIKVLGVFAKFLYPKI